MFDLIIFAAVIYIGYKIFEQAKQSGNTSPSGILSSAESEIKNLVSTFGTEAGSMYNLFKPTAPVNTNAATPPVTKSATIPVTVASIKTIVTGSAQQTKQTAPLSTKAATQKTPPTRTASHPQTEQDSNISPLSNLAQPAYAPNEAQGEVYNQEQLLPEEENGIVGYNPGGYNPSSPSSYNPGGYNPSSPSSYNRSSHLSDSSGFI